jgi:hypothetical protein
MMESPSTQYEGISPELKKAYDALYYEFYIFAVFKFLNIREDALVKLDTHLAGVG